MCNCMVFSPVWILICCLSVLLFANDLSQSWQLYVFTCMNSHMLLKLVTVCKCRVTQYATVWFSPVLTLTCRVRSPYLTKDLVHSWQLNILVLSTGTSLECIYLHWEARFPICATQCATKWHFTCMNSHMTGHLIFAAKSCIALLTTEHLCLSEGRFNCCVSIWIIIFALSENTKTIVGRTSFWCSLCTVCFLQDMNYHLQCCGSGFGSVRIRNF
jgi:hypothetical protein